LLFRETSKQLMQQTSLADSGIGYPHLRPTRRITRQLSKQLTRRHKAELRAFLRRAHELASALRFAP
jgi:hypothetical protein